MGRGIRIDGVFGVTCGVLRRITNMLDAACRPEHAWCVTRGVCILAMWCLVVVVVLLLLCVWSGVVWSGFSSPACPAIVPATRTQTDGQPDQQTITNLTSQAHLRTHSTANAPPLPLQLLLLLLPLSHSHSPSRSLASLAAWPPARTLTKTPKTQDPRPVNLRPPCLLPRIQHNTAQHSTDTRQT